MDTTQLIAAQLTLQSLSSARSPGQTLSQTFSGRSNDVAQQISFAEFSQQLLQQGRAERQPDHAEPTTPDQHQTKPSDDYATHRNEIPDEAHPADRKVNDTEKVSKPDREHRIDEAASSQEPDPEPAASVAVPSGLPSEPPLAPQPTIVNATFSAGADVNPESTVSPDALQIVVASAPANPAATLNAQSVSPQPTQVVDAITGSGTQTANAVIDQIHPAPGTGAVAADIAAEQTAEPPANSQNPPGASVTASPEPTQPPALSITQQTQAIANADAADQQALQNVDTEPSATAANGSDSAATVTGEHADSSGDLNFGSSHQQGATNTAGASTGQSTTGSSPAPTSFADNITLPMTTTGSQATAASASGKPVPGTTTINLDSLLSSSPTNQAVDQAMKTLRHSALESLRNEGKEVQLEIAPKHLGALKVQVRQTGEGLETQIIATERMASELLNGNRDQLAQALQELGYDSVDVDIRHQGGQSEDAWQDSSSGDLPQSLPTDSMDQPKRSLQDRPDESGGLNIVA